MYKYLKLTKIFLAILVIFMIVSCGGDDSSTTPTSSLTASNSTAVAQEVASSITTLGNLNDLKNLPSNSIGQRISKVFSLVKSSEFNPDQSELCSNKDQGGKLYIELNNNNDYSSGIKKLVFENCTIDNETYNGTISYEKDESGYDVEVYDLTQKSHDGDELKIKLSFKLISKSDYVEYYINGTMTGTQEGKKVNEQYKDFKFSVKTENDIYYYDIKGEMYFEKPEFNGWVKLNTNKTLKQNYGYPDCFVDGDLDIESGGAKLNLRYKEGSFDIYLNGNYIETKTCTNS